MTFALTASTLSPRATVSARPRQLTHDPLLLPFVQAKSEERAEAHLSRLIWAVAYPIIKSKARHFVPYDSAAVDDICADVMASLTSRLQTARGEGSIPMPNYEAYVRVAAKNACFNYMAKKRETCFSVLGNGSGRSGVDGDRSPEDFLTAKSNVEAHVSRRAQLRAVWSEILLLPQAQRAVLLLNLRAPDNSSALRFLAAAGTNATQLAGALNITGDELTELLPVLPLDDALIASRLSLSPTEIRTLRLAARRRLARRVRAWL